MRHTSAFRANFCIEIDRQLKFGNKSISLTTGVSLIFRLFHRHHNFFKFIDYFHPEKK
jgi:hypothetical protein